RRPEPAHVFLRRLGVVLPGVRIFNLIAQPLAGDAARAHANLPLADLQRAERILEKRLVPAALRQRPRSREHTAVDDDRPDADEFVIGALARTNAHDLADI